MDTVRLAKFVMRLMETAPEPPTSHVGTLSEVFTHPLFLEGDDETRRRIMLDSARAKHLDECSYPWDVYFGVDLKPMLQGRSLLDLGCFTGGRSAAWYERYGLERLTGIDVDPVYIEAAMLFAERQGIRADFRLGVGESLPFPSNSFDAILTFDVFEHVRDVRLTLAECFRVLQPGGRLFVVFPSYFQPVEHHLSHVTRVPFLNLAFPGATLIQAYCEILDDRGAEANWYRRWSRELEPWERGHTLNGMTSGRFRALVEDQGWRVRLRSKKPLGSVGRNMAQKPTVKILSRLLAPLARAPLVEEIALHRITYILEKPR